VAWTDVSEKTEKAEDVGYIHVHVYRVDLKVSLIIIAITLYTAKVPTNFHNGKLAGTYVTGHL